MAISTSDNLTKLHKPLKIELQSPVVLKLDDDSAPEIPVYEISESPERKKRNSSRTRRKVG